MTINLKVLMSYETMLLLQITVFKSFVTHITLIVFTTAQAALVPGMASQPVNHSHTGRVPGMEHKPVNPLVPGVV